METSATPIQITLDELKARYLWNSLTAEERKGIQESWNDDGLIVLTLPPSFHWVPVEQAAPSLYTYRHIAINGVKRIQLKYDSCKTIVEVTVLKP